MLARNVDLDGFILKQGEWPLEAALLSEFISFYSYSHLLVSQTDLIEKRYKTSNVSIILKNFKITAGSLGNIWETFIDSDATYQIMFGLSFAGLNLLNESAYLGNKYGFMRVSSSNPLKDSLSIADNELSREELKEFFEEFIKQYGDMDLYNFYLYPPESVKYPRFGVSQYQCSDLDPITGEKKETE